jgi:hypothetical protein
MQNTIGHPRLIALFLVGAFITTNSHAQSSWDVQYGYANVFAPNAQNYIVQQQNIQTTDEGAGVTYWNPIVNGTPAVLTQEFTFSAPSTEIYLSADIASFNFGGNDYGSGSLWASTDGINWTELMSAPTPAYPGYEYGYAYFYSADLPSSLLGANQIYIQAQLNTSGENILAQFMRENATGAGNYPPFALDANVAPEPSTASLIIGGILIGFLLRYKKQD